MGEEAVIAYFDQEGEQMRCGNCVWWAAEQVRTNAGAQNGPAGRCRRHAPTANGWPGVRVDECCGEHKRNEHAGGG